VSQGDRGVDRFEACARLCAQHLETAVEVFKPSLVGVLSTRDRCQQQLAGCRDRVAIEREQ
jgi:hypothetical protein